MRFWTRRRKRSEYDHFSCSGYVDEAEYERREPSWAPSEEFPSVETATEVGLAWLAAGSERAQVEVIGFTGREGDVLRVLTADGIEEI